MWTGNQTPTFETNDYQGQLSPLQMDSDDAEPIGQNGNYPIKNFQGKP